MSEKLEKIEYRKCRKDKFYLTIEPSKFPADDRRGDIVSIFKKGLIIDTLVNSKLCTHGDGGDELKEVIWDMYNEMELYIKFSV